MCDISSVARSLPKPFSAGHSVELKRSTKDDILSLKFPSGMSPAISMMGDSMILSSLEDLDGERQAAFFFFFFFFFATKTLKHFFVV